MDPFCGSGTLLIESALIASRTAPGLVRMSLAPRGEHAFAFQSWPSFDEKRFDSVVEEAQSEVIQHPPNRNPFIFGCDRDAGIIKVARRYESVLHR